MSDNNIAKEKFEEGMADFVSRNYGRSVDLLSKALELNPDYGAVYYSRANLHNKMGHPDLATEDIRMVTHFSEINIESFANENNVWRSQYLRLESMYDDDLTMER